MSNWYKKVITRICWICKKNSTNSLPCFINNYNSKSEYDYRLSLITEKNIYTFDFDADRWYGTTYT